MTNTVQWQTPADPATDSMVASVEALIGHKFPSDYREIARFAHGGRPTPNSFSYTDRDIGPVETSIGILLSLNPASNYYIPLVLSMVEEGIIPAGVVPFGEDGGGDMMAFDFRSDPSYPPVVYVAIADADEGGSGRNVYPLAPSFSAFLDMLVADPDQPSPSDDRVDEVPSTADRR